MSVRTINTHRGSVADIYGEIDAPTGVRVLSRPGRPGATLDELEEEHRAAERQRWIELRERQQREGVL